MKQCTGCKKTKPLEDFHNKRSSKDGKQSKCKDCNKESVIKWQQDNPERTKELWTKHTYGDTALLKRRAQRYGLSVEKLKNMLEESDGICEICKREPHRWLVVDHCHKTLKIRGLICERCNTALGLLQDNVDWLENAKQYLTK